MANLNVQEYTPNTSRYNKRITNEEWTRLKPRLKELHDRKLTRQAILDIVEPEFGDVKPTYGQLCTKFEKWGFRVYKGKNSAGLPSPSTVLDSSPHGETLPYHTPPGSSGGIQQGHAVPDVSRLTIDEVYHTPQKHLVDQRWTGHSYPVTISYDSPIRRPFDSTDTSQPYHTPQSFATQSMATPRAHAHQLSDTSTVWDESQQPAYMIPERSSDVHPAFRSHEQPMQTRSDSSVESDPPKSIYSAHSAHDTLSERTSTEQDETRSTTDIFATTDAGSESASIIVAYLRSVSKDNTPNTRYAMMANLAAFMFSTRAYAAAFKIYHKLYETIQGDSTCDEICRIGAVFKCAQAASDAAALVLVQRELDQVLRWQLSDALVRGMVVQTLADVEVRLGRSARPDSLPESQGSLMASNKRIVQKAVRNSSPIAQQLHWRRRLMEHSFYHSGCARFLRTLFELLTWAWEALTVRALPMSGRGITGCFCSDPFCTDMVRMLTVSLLDFARGLDINSPDSVDFGKINEIPCTCVMCSDLQTTFSICPMETFTAIALLTVNECRLRHISRERTLAHKAQAASRIRNEQIVPTVQFLLGDLYANWNDLTNIAVTDLYDDYLSCLWSCFETHANTGQTQFNPDASALDTLITTMISDEVIVSTSPDPTLAPPLDLSHHSPSRPDSAILQRLVLDTKVGAKRTRSNASSTLQYSLSTASRASEQSFRETAQRAKRLKYRSSIGQLSALSPANSIIGVSPLSSRGSQNRFSYVTGYPMELESMAEGDEPLPPDEPDSGVRLGNGESRPLKNDVAAKSRLGHQHRKEKEKKSKLKIKD